MKTVHTSSFIVDFVLKKLISGFPRHLALVFLLSLGGMAVAEPLPVFPDQKLQSCFEEQAALQGWTIAEEVRELVCVDRGIRDIYGIEQLPFLESLDLSENLIRDLIPLGSLGWPSLPRLVSLRLADNALVDLYPLQGYTELQTLWLSGNSALDFQQLRPIIEQNMNLTRIGLGDIDLQDPWLPWLNIDIQAIVELDLSNTGIEWLWGIEGYSSLEVLDVSDNQIVDILPLYMTSQFDRLSALNLANNRVVDVYPLQHYTQLQTLWLSGNSGIDFQQLRPIIEQNPSLTRLGLGDIDLQEPGLPWFGNMGMLTELDISNTGIEWLWGIESYASLQVLNATDNNISDLQPLGMWPLLNSLQELDLANNLIHDVAPLQGYMGLRKLWLSGNSGLDIQQLRTIIEQNVNITRLGLGDIDLHEPGMPWFMLDTSAIVELDVSNTGIEGLWGLESYVSLQSLDASDNTIVDLYSLNELSWSGRLRKLNLANNRIADVSPLQNYTGLQTLWLSGNRAIDFQQLRPIIDQNEHLVRLGLGDIDLQEPGLPWCSSDASSLVELDVSNTGIVFLWGIESYPSLQILDASDNKIFDLYPLNNLPLSRNLRELDLANNEIVDVYSLLDITNLRSLWLSGNEGIDFQELRPIIELNQKLTRLGLADIDFQEPGLPWLNIDTWAVIELDIRNTGIEGLWGIQNYSGLKILDASNNAIVDLYPLIMWPLSANLRELRLENNQINDPTPLQSISGLRTLWLSGNESIDFKQLRPIIEMNQNLTRLGLGDINLQEPGLPWLNINTAAVIELDVSNTGIEWLWGIQDYTSLQILNASDNAIFDLYALNNLPLSQHLRELRLFNNQIVDVSPLQSFTELRTLWLSGNSGIKFQQLRFVIEQNQKLTRLGLGDIDLQEPGLPWLNIDTSAIVELDVNHTGIEGLWGIESYKGLETLYTADNDILDIDQLFYLPELTFVDLDGNTNIPCEQLNELEQILGPDGMLWPMTCM